jgi:hypothetical protein
MLLWDCFSPDQLKGDVVHPLRFPFYLPVSGHRLSLQGKKAFSGDNAFGFVYLRTYASSRFRVAAFR